MDNLALQIIDEECGNDFQEGFKIDNDNLAEWAIKKIAEERAEAQRYINVCETMILEYQQKAQKAQEQLISKTSYLQSQLQEYFSTVPHKATKTQETYRLPSGTLKMKYGTPKFIRDEEKLVIWLENRGDEFSQQYIKIKKSADWENLKKDLAYSINGDKLITSDGEIVEGVTAQERPNTFEVDI